MSGRVLLIVNSLQSGRAAPFLIGIGLVILVAASWWPIPAVTGLSFIALGATTATVARFREPTALASPIALHFVVYSGLYVLFVGSSVHAAMRNSSEVGFVLAVDLILSLGPMAAALAITA